jgi:hypothetical protein
MTEPCKVTRWSADALALSFTPASGPELYFPGSFFADGARNPG